jgi:hypothetical protein
MVKKIIHITGENLVKVDDLNKKLDNINLSDPFGMTLSKKKPFFQNLMQDLTKFHYENSFEYRNFTNILKNFTKCPETLQEIPTLPVQMFKQHDLLSISKNLVYKTLNSSGTSGQNVSKIYIDATTAKRQSKFLSSITKNFIGDIRLPMIIVDSNELFKDRTKINARSAGILGYSVFGRDHFYCLDKNLNLLVNELKDFLEKYRDQPILIFGFTFIVWQSLLKQAMKQKLKLDFGKQSILIHGGGWKKLEDQKVNNHEFKKSLKKNLGINRIHNYYGMIEQVGSIFMECEYGHLHCPVYADIIIRDQINFNPNPNNKEGIIQVLSLLPISYPGHSLLTEDLGTIHGEDDCKCGRNGKYFTVSGRLPLAELRGCSDTRVLKK